MKSWGHYPYIFIDKGKIISKNSPALLKTRRYVDYRKAVEWWKMLKENGFNRIQPKW